VSFLTDRRLLVALVASLVFVAIAAAVLRRGDDQPVRALDFRVRAAFKAAADEPGVRPVATVLTRLTGEGLVAAVAVAAIALFVTRRRLEAWVVVLGTIAAWLTSMALKVAFGVPRPRAYAAFRSGHAGFPSGHAFVSLVACGLIAWAVGRRCSRRLRLALFTLAVVVAGGSAISRLVLDAHWLSDAVAGLAFGAAWLNVAIVLGEDRCQR
jgi:membrane-associated phospholipid phosphatase